MATNLVIKVKQVVCIILLVISSSHASHIIGGEITLAYQSGTTYTVKLNLYFDLINGNPAAKDPEVQLSFYDKATNTLLDTIRVPLTSSADIPTEKGVCSFIKLQMRKLTYSKTISFDATKYNGSQGFYAAWERCCRNSATINIRNPDRAATAFYSEFAPLNAKNSSPEFATPAKNGFACVGIPATYDFKATDVDGDVLNYELGVPLNGNLTGDAPGNWAQPAPYQPVSFINGISISNMIPGNPALNINSTTGEALFTGTLAGIYVFSVRSNSYKNGVYMGSVNRDFQLSVLRCGVENTKPVLQVFNPNTNAEYNPSDTIKIDNRFVNCMAIKAIDTVQGQRLTVRTNPISFYTVITVSPNLYVTKSKTDTANFSICLPSCASTRTSPFQIQVILANENNCALPKYDTTLVVLKNIAPKNTKTNISTTLNNLEAVAMVSKPLVFDVTANNTDANQLKLYGKGVGFQLKDRKMEFSSITGSVLVTSPFAYIPSCEDLTLGNAKVYFIARDSSCLSIRYDTLPLTVRVVDTIINYQVPLVNVITPNGDGINDKFEILNLPKDNCTEVFSAVEIYNRWGLLLYQSKERAFNWDAQGATDGLYYYYLKYNKRQLKSWLQVVR